MSSFRIRPRFRHTIAGEKQAIENEILNDLKANDDLMVTHLKGHIYVKTTLKNRHTWSPQLHISFEEDDDNTIIRGLYGPNPTLWAIYFFGYVSLGVLTLFIGMWGLSRWSLGMSSQMLWLIPVFGVIALMLYLSAQTGQKLGAQEMFDMHHAFEGSIHRKVRIS